MSFHPNHLRNEIIIPTLELLEPVGIGNVNAAAQLLLGTCAAESLLGQWRHQMGGGPALSIYQIEPNTERDVWENFLDYNPKIAERVRYLMYGGGNELQYNDFYATAIARLVYFRDPFKLPEHGNIVHQAQTWKRVFNTGLGAGTVDHYLKNWKALVDPKYETKV
jgi:hypothetical protein